MSDFVYDATALPSGKSDARPLTGPAENHVTAAEWNTVMQAIVDLRDAVLAGNYHGLVSDPTAPLPGALGVRIRNNAGVLELSNGGTAFAAVTADGASPSFDATRVASTTYAYFASGVSDIDECKLRNNAGSLELSEDNGDYKKVVKNEDSPAFVLTTSEALELGGSTLDPSQSGMCKLRNNSGVLEVSEDGGDYSSIAKVYEITGTSDVTTSSATYVLCDAMTLTPAAGKYWVHAEGTVHGSALASDIRMAVFVDGVMVAASVRRRQGVSDAVGCSTAVVDCTGVEAVELRWSIDAGTATMHERSMVLIKVS